MDWPFYATDEFTHGLLQMFKAREISLSLSMITTCLDIRQILGDSVDNAFHQFWKLHENATEKVGRFMDLASKSLEQPSV